MRPGIMVLTPDGKLSRYFLRHRFSLARFAAWAGRGVGGQDRLAHRFAAAVLLSLRLGDGAIHGERVESGAAFRRS